MSAKLQKIWKCVKNAAHLDFFFTEIEGGGIPLCLSCYAHLFVGTVIIYLFYIYLLEDN